MHRNLASLASLLLLSLIGFGAAAAATEGPALLPILSGGDSAAPTVRVLERDAQSLLLEFSLPALETQSLEVEGETYQVLAIEGGDVEGGIGEPMLPTFSRLIQIPDRSGVTFETQVVESRRLTGYRVMPVQPDEPGAFAIDRATYARAGLSDAHPARIGEPALARDLRVVPISFSPVRYDPAAGAIEVAGRVQVRVHFAGVDLRNAGSGASPSVPESFDALYRSLVVNYEGPRDGQIVARGAYVLLCPNNTTVVNCLQPLVEWRTRQGYEVHLATTAETGTTKEAIKTWLQTAYNTWTNKPEFVSLVGDVSGTIAMPYWQEQYSGWGAETDHPYTQLNGGDILADINIGRISVDTTDRLTLYVNKIIGYESTPYMTDTSWFTRGCVVGDASHSGYTCIQIMQWIKERLRQIGYTQVDTVFSGDFVGQMTTDLNRGDTVFSYRGYYGMSGWTTGNISALANGAKMPYAVNLTCDTGSFASGTSRSEAWIRAGNPPNTPTGGIASVGTATTGTDTRHNNCMTGGIWRGALWEGLYRFGASFTRGKYELYINYAQQDYNDMCIFTCWNNLMGDAAGELWTGVPHTLSITYPSTLPVGANAVVVSATASGAPVAGAYVCLWKGSETFVGGTTGADGTLELPVSATTTGTMKLTVTKHDYLPVLRDISISSATRFAGYQASTIDDDASGTSSGNGNGLVNPTERIELPVQVKNLGTQALTGVTGTLSSDDPYVTIPDNAETFGDIAPGASAWSGDDFDVVVAGGAPHGRVLKLNLDLTSGTDTWRSLIQLPVVSAMFIYDAVTLTGFGTAIDPGESGQMSVRVINKGGMAATGTVGTLISRSPWVTVTDASGTYGTVNMSGSSENTGDRFALSVAADCFQGHVAPMSVAFNFSGGAVDTVDFSLNIGTATSDDPTGPDHYGYYAFDNTDTTYPDFPTYSWVEIDPAQGGSGTSVGLTDMGDSQDDSQTITLPFTFKYYGVNFTRATICSNGWIAMGSTYLTQYRNWNIPGAEAPANMIAPMWDDLYQSGSNRVCQKYDSANHRYIVEWSRLINNNGGATETFEAILLDPAYYPTDTGDGIIIFQYNAFTNCDSEQHFCTVGIENENRDDGVMYSYYNLYNTGAATITAGRAVKFMPISVTPRGNLVGTIVNASNGGTPVGGAQVHVVETGDSFVSGANGAYGGSVRVGQYTVTCTHPSFQSQTMHAVWINEGETTTLNFALTDIAGPVFYNTTVLGTTTDETGPYGIDTHVSEYSAVSELSLRYNVNGAGWVTVALQNQGGDLYHAAIPGQPRGSLIHYYLYGRDNLGLVGTDPVDAPQDTYTFWVLAPILSDDSESGAGNWTHAVVTGGFVDQWHQSTQRNHTPDGTTAWKFGDTGAGSYADLGDGALVSEPMTLQGDARLTFWHWMESEVSGSYPDHAYDGGLVEISVDGGAWTQIMPDGGYPYLIRSSSQAGPFAAETPVYGGTQDWAQASFDLTGITGVAQIRFRFGSDGNTGREGWYIDDVEVVGGSPDPAGAPEVKLIPTRLALYANRPNPFGAQAERTVIRCDLPRAAALRLAIFDVGGRLVRTLADRRVEAGRYDISWNGLDDGGRRVDSGVYFYVLSTDGRQITRRMMLLR
jgi:hypothetical protein